MKTIFTRSVFKAAFVMGWLLSIGLMWSCQKDAIPPAPVSPAPSEGNNSQDNPPSNGPKLKRITWAETDFQEYEYNADGLLAKYISQWLYVMGTDQVKRVESVFEYNAQKRIARLVVDNQMEVKYYYKGDFLEKSEEYDQKGRLAVTHYYTFNNQHQPLEIRDVITDPLDGNKVTGELKHEYAYDERGNNTVQKEWVKNLQTGAYEFNSSLHFEGFDNNRYVENAVALNPYVPHAKLWTNHFTSRTIRGKNGQVLQPAQLYAYECNEQGYPLRKSMGNANVKIWATVTYEEPK